MKLFVQSCEIVLVRTTSEKKNEEFLREFSESGVALDDIDGIPFAAVRVHLTRRSSARATD